MADSNSLIAANENLKKTTLDFKKKIDIFVSDAEDSVTAISSAAKYNGIDGTIGNEIRNTIDKDLRSISASLEGLKNISDQLEPIADDYQKIIDFLKDSMS